MKDMLLLDWHRQQLYYNSWEEPTRSVYMNDLP